MSSKKKDEATMHEGAVAAAGASLDKTLDESKDAAKATAAAKGDAGAKAAGEANPRTVTVGRIVHYHLARWKDQPIAAIVTAVHLDGAVGLKVFGPDGSHEHKDGVNFMPAAKVAEAGTLNNVWTWPPRV